MPVQRDLTRPPSGRQGPHLSVIIVKDGNAVYLQALSCILLGTSSLPLVGLLAMLTLAWERHLNHPANYMIQGQKEFKKQILRTWTCSPLRGHRAEMAQDPLVADVPLQSTLNLSVTSSHG